MNQFSHFKIAATNILSQKYEAIDNNSYTMWKFQWLAQVAPFLWNCI